MSRYLSTTGVAMTTRFSRKRKGFTLMELLVVMAILGIIMAMIVPKAGNLIANSRENKCRNNLRQLQAAVMSYMNDNGGNLPYAMSYEVRLPSMDKEHDWVYYERRAWIAWSPDKKPDNGTIDKLNRLWSGDGQYEQHEPALWHDLGFGDLAKFGVENGTLFGYMNNSLEHYVCPVVRAAFSGADVWRTYAMNPFFHGPGSRSWDPRVATRIGTSEGSKGRTPEASKLLLFIETLPNMEEEPYQRNFDPDDAASDDPIIGGDCCITPKDADDSDDAPPAGNPEDTRQYPWLHKVPKGSFTTPDATSGYVAMAVFFDGHIEKIANSAINPVWAYNRGLDPAGKLTGK